MTEKISVSVIVPVYNVIEYLDECLSSLAGQTLKDIEVIMIDDGSTDGSAEVAKQYAARDNRFRYIESDSGGPGAARNIGMDHAKGEYLCFADSDDIVPPYAYEKMYEAAVKNSADIVVGNAMRLRNGKYGTARALEIIFSNYEHLTNLQKNNILVYDTISCNKMVRRAYRERENVYYPAKIAYEDEPFTFELYYRTDKIIMLDDIVYLWRIREDVSNESLTQRNTMQTVYDRITALRILKKYCDENVTEKEIIRAKKYKSLMIDLNVLINKAVDFNDDDLKLSLSLIREYMLEDGLQEEIGRLPVIYKQKYKAVLAENITRLRELREFQDGVQSSIQTVRIGRIVKGIFPRRILKRRIADMKTTLDAELLRQSVTNLEILEDRVVIKGCAFMRFLPVSKTDGVHMECWLIDERRNKIKQLDLLKRNTKKPEKMESKKNSNKIEYKGTGYQIEINRKNTEGIPDGTYKILMVWEACGQHREVPIFPVTARDIRTIRSEGGEVPELGLVVSTTLKKEPIFTFHA